ncbi:hypothetical protein FHS19_004401 [Paenibacillus rhizosphaerae]|uniref:Copper amine oxidase-like N-terminal domain-containing protein n=1 Tax=Paenibacillus rhizosphaerae TaxID=297318 RepID=A0A839TSB8_9BACL|nr:stalk domain-containing protein [Paenibacillus rhizosphaerae]MBB3129726.1 hypothetical protein [Paenibacillus rhizosphaerae]
MKKLIIGLTVGMLIGSSTVAMAATSTTVKATIAKYRVLINGVNKPVASNQLLYNGNTYVQLRDAGSIFGYDVSYKASDKSINFTVKNSPDSNWITITDFATANGYTIKVDNASTDTYNIQANNSTVLAVNISNLKENEERALTSTNGKVVTVKRYLGSYLLNKTDLIRGGFMN